MEVITLKDLEYSDVYYTILSFIINFEKHKSYSKKSIIDFKNFTIANPRALLDKNVKKYISRCLVCNNINNYFDLMDKAIGNIVIKKPHSREVRFGSIYRITYNLPLKNRTFYKTVIPYVIYSNYFNYSNEIRIIIYENIKKLLDIKDIGQIRYINIIEKLLKIYSFKGYNQFKIIFMVFIKNLKKDLIKNNIESTDRDKIISSTIRSLNWELKENNL